MDDEVNDLLKEKIKGFEMPVDDQLWSKIQKEVKPVQTERSFNGRKTIYPLVFLLVVSVTLGPRFFRSEQRALQNQDPTSVPLAEQSKRVSSDQIEVLNEITKIHSQHPEAENIPMNSQASDKKVKLNDIDFDIQEEAAIDKDLFATRRSQLEELALLPYHNALPALASTDSTLRSGTPIEVTDVSVEKRKVTIGFSARQTFDFLNIRPNVNDDVYLKDVITPFDLSLNRLGIGVGYQLLVPLNDRISYKHDLLFSVKQYPIALEYQSEASNPENRGFTEIDKTFIHVGMELSSGLVYELKPIGQRKIALDATFSLAGQFKNSLDKEFALGHPGAVWNINLGLTVSPKSGEKGWDIRPFMFHSLNRKFSGAPVNLTPYGFGVQFTRR